MGIFRRLITPTGEVRPFKFTIRTTTSNQVYELPLVSIGGKQPNIAVTWGDGQSETITSATSASRFHTFTTADDYEISINGYLPGFSVNNNSTYKSLYRSVVDWGNVGLEEIDFYGCSNLSTLPNDGASPIPNATLNEGLNTIKKFDSTFRQTGITYIPIGLFDYASGVTSFTDTFLACFGLSGDAIPDELFRYNTLVTSFSGTFNACLNLTLIPGTLFDYNTNVTNFSSVFRNCRGLTQLPEGLFNNNQSVTNFSNAFNMATTANALQTGSTPTDDDGDEIYDRTPRPTGTDCFAFCTGLSNYASIPADFK